jgi:predicted Rdx family selenoprotein
VADLLKRELGVETELIGGDRGEFTVWVGDHIVASKNQSGFPEDDKVLEAVKETLKYER